jgi:RimJ/RimL family protein N-acetyltransferase
MYWTEIVKSGYTVNRESREKCAALMEKIRSESPGYWPNGLDIGGFDDIYMVRKASDNEPVGFVGWQTRIEKYARVGYYSIGILPEYRKQGFAKQAVSEMLEKCAATVDVVRAFIMPSNAPSHALADSLGVPVVHKVAMSLGAKLLAAVKSPAARNIGMGLGTGLGFDAMQYGNHGLESYTKDITAGRVGRLLFNSVLGGVGVNRLTRGTGADAAAGATAIGMIPGKDILMGLVPATDKVAPAIQAITDKTNKGSLDPKALATIIGGGALAGAGLLGANMLRKALLNNASARNGGRVNIKLPTKAPGDAETSVDLPIEEVQLSNPLRQAIGRDTRRRLREESKERKWKRGQDGKLITRGESVSDADALEDVTDVEVEKLAYLNLLVS